MLHSAGSKLFIGLWWVASLCQGQRTPTISYFTPSPIEATIGETIEMDCSVLYASEYPVIWVKFPKHCKSIIESEDFELAAFDTGKQKWIIFEKIFLLLCHSFNT